MASNCNRQLYKEQMCRKHYLDYVGQTLRKEIKLLYRDPETAYASMDFEGNGKISFHEFIESIVVQKTKFDLDDVEGFLLRDRIYKDRKGEIEFEKFKKQFFPHLYHISDKQDLDTHGQSDKEVAIFGKP